MTWNDHKTGGHQQPFKRSRIPTPKRVTLRSCLRFFLGNQDFLFQLDATEIWRIVLHQTYMDVSKNSGTPKSSLFNKVFHYKPSIFGYYFWKHPYPSRFKISGFLAPYRRCLFVLASLASHPWAEERRCFLCVFFYTPEEENWGFIRIY